MVDFIWGTLRGRLYEDSFTWTILHGPTIAGHYSKAIHLYELIVVMTLLLPVLIIVLQSLPPNAYLYILTRGHLPHSLLPWSLALLFLPRPPWKLRN